jgi:hypothetical protein
MSDSNLTTSLILSLKARKKGYIKRDKKVKGLYVRVMPSGRKSPALEFRRRDESHRPTLCPSRNHRQRSQNESQ